MLTLSVLRCPPSVAPERREIKGGEISIGRGRDCDWTLPDPQRHLSRRHCVVAYRAGAWQVADVSSGGTYLNHEDAPIGSATPRPLRHGDRLRLGTYEIEVDIAAERAPERAGAVAERLPEDPFDDGSPWRTEDPLLPFPNGPDSPTPVVSPADFDPLAPDSPDRLFQGPTVSDHTPVVDDAFRPPRPVSHVLPPDWDFDLPLPVSGQAKAADPAPSPLPPLPPINRPVPPAAPPQHPVEDAGDLMAAFLRGAGLSRAQPADPAAAMEALGQAFRAFVTGLRGTMIARAAVKGEFRIEQTMVRARGNNPLKFSANDEDALAALLGAGRHVDTTPAQAVAEALHDVRLHELATVAAMREAVRALVARLDPAPLREDAEAAGWPALLPAQRKARAWDAYEALHAGTVRALQDDFDAAFGLAFARAYEAALQAADRGANNAGDRA